MQIDKDLNSEYAELFLDVREYLTSEIGKYVDKVKEKYSDNITTIYAKELSSAFCYIRIKDDYVHIGWFNGAKIEDKLGLLFGTGKQIRGHKIKLFDDACKTAISFYVEQSYIRLVEKDAIKCMRNK